MSSLGGLLNKARALKATARASAKQKHDRQVIKTWLCFVVYCNGGPEAERRFGDTLRTGPVFHPSVRAHYEGLFSQCAGWIDPTGEASK